MGKRKIFSMKISIVTIAYNSGSTIKDTIESVLKQTYTDIEYIIVDGLSIDQTLPIIAEYHPKFNGRMHWVSEKDDGIYDAMNKGINLATGEIVGILNSDDFFTSDRVIEKIVAAFKVNTVDGIYGDICFVKPENLNKVIRYYSSAWFNPSLFRFGFMPSHPSFYVQRKMYEKYGLYRTDFSIASDYELLIRYIKINKLQTLYLNTCMVTMRTGGASTHNFKSNWILNKEIVRGCRENGIYTNMLILSLRYLIKMFEFIFPNRTKA